MGYPLGRSAGYLVVVNAMLAVWSMDPMAGAVVHESQVKTIDWSLASCGMWLLAIIGNPHFRSLKSSPPGGKYPLSGRAPK